MSDSSQPDLPRGAAIYLAVVQFFFVTTWTIYVIYLPRLLAAAGLPPRYTVWILMLDQLVFMATDIFMGVAADRAGRMLGRIGPLIVGATALSCTAFLLLPHATLLGVAAPAVSVVLILVWTATSSALRAPPWVLLSKYAAAPSFPWLNAIALSGLALGGAVAPYLGVTLKNIDPRVPFALSSLTLLATAVGLIWVERVLARQRGAAPAAPQVQTTPFMPAPADSPPRGLPLFLIGCLALALGFQIHSALNSASLYLRFAAADRLEYLLPVFWIGFNLAMFPGAALARRYGTFVVIAVAGATGALAAYAGIHAPTLEALVTTQLVAGGAWGCIMMAGFSAALMFGRTGREGRALGLLFATLAFATLSRMGATAAQLNKDPDYAQLLTWAPVELWLAGALMIAALAMTSPRRVSA